MKKVKGVKKSKKFERAALPPVDDGFERVNASDFKAVTVATPIVDGYVLYFEKKHKDSEGHRLHMVTAEHQKFICFMNTVMNRYFLNPKGTAMRPGLAGSLYRFKHIGMGEKKKGKQPANLIDILRSKTDKLTEKELEHFSKL